MKRRLAALAAIMVIANAGCGDGSQPKWMTIFSGSTPWYLLKKERQGKRLILVYLTYVEAVSYPQAARNVRDRLQQIEVTETADTVAIRLDQIIEQRKGKVVGTQGVPVEVPVELERPLGSRRLLPPQASSSTLRLSPERAGDALVRINGAGDGACDQELWSED